MPPATCGASPPVPTATFSVNLVISVPLPPMNWSERYNNLEMERAERQSSASEAVAPIIGPAPRRV